MNQTTSYGDFATVYDKLTADVEYKKRTDYVEKLFLQHLDSSPEIVCDLGCGTGTVCSMLCDKGYDVIGIDNSASMLNVAISKNRDGKVLFLNQDICDFELYGTVDVFLSMLDTVNYITDISALERMFCLVANYLNPGGVFVFDVNSRHKFENVLADNTFVFEEQDIFYTWENYYEDELLDFELNFFVKSDDGNYSRFTEHHTQRYYDKTCIFECAAMASLDVVAVYGEMTTAEPTSDCERVFYVLKKRHVSSMRGDKKNGHNCCYK